MKFSPTLSISFILLLAVFFISSSSGRSDRRAAAPGDFSGCNGCHGGNQSVDAVLTGVPSVITPGTTYSLTLTANDPNVTYSQAGFQIAASNGTALPTNVGTFTPGVGSKINPINRLVQSTPLAYDANRNASWSFDWTAPTTNTDTEVTFFFSVNSVNSNGGTSGDNTINANSINIPVPVSWTYSDVEQLSQSLNKVTWGTAMEQNTDQFEIQMSQQGKDFRSIGFVDAAFESHRDLHYEFEHNHAQFGDMFYRIKQVDFNGEFTYSEILHTYVKQTDISVYPTVVVDHLNIEGDVTNMDVTIIDMNGRSYEVSIQNKVLHLVDLPSGIYVANFVQDGQLVSQSKFVKQ